MTIYDNYGSVLYKNFIKGVIFDCDGVLVDSEPFSCGALNVLFEKYFNIDIGNDYSPVIGSSLKDTFSYYLEKYGITNADQSVLAKIYIEKDEVYKNLAKNKLRPFSGISQFINFCHTYNFRISVGSSGTLNKISFSLKESGLDQYFDVITSADEVKHGKPEPDLFLLTAKKMQIDPKDCLVVEDSLSGIIAGNKAGMYTVGITNTFSRDKLKKADPKLIIDNVMELT